MLYKIKSTYVFLIIGFMISACTINLAVSSVVPYIKMAMQKNEFNKDKICMSISKENGSLNLGRMNKELQKIGINNFCMAPVETEVILDNSYISSLLWVIPKGTNFFDNVRIKKLSDNYKGFDNGKNYIIVGENIEKVAKVKGDKKYLNLFEKEYEIIGVIKGSEYLKSSILISGSASEFKNKKINAFGIYVEKDEVDKLKSLKEEGFNIEGYNIPEESIIDLLSQIPLELEKRFYELMVGIFNLVIFSYFFSNTIKKEISIKRILGASNKYVLKSIFSKMIVLSLIGTSLGICISSAIGSFMNKTNSYAYGDISLLGSGITTVIVIAIAFIVTLLVLFNVIRFKIMKEIR